MSTLHLSRLADGRWNRVDSGGEIQITEDVQARFWSRAARGDGCWNWTGAKQPSGYGYKAFVRGGRRVSVSSHRIAYYLLVGPVPVGLDLDHLCRNRLCCNPAHLEPVTAGENLRRGEGITGRSFRATSCARGHEYTDENTYRPRDGVRICRRCVSLNVRKYEQRRVDAGRCRRCPAVVEAPHTLCARHLEYARQLSARARQRKASA